MCKRAGELERGHMMMAEARETRANHMRQEAIRTRRRGEGRGGGGQQERSKGEKKDYIFCHHVQSLQRKKERAIEKKRRKGRQKRDRKKNRKRDSKRDTKRDRKRERVARSCHHARSPRPSAHPAPVGIGSLGW
jgi:hypothetical protein